MCQYEPKPSCGLRPVSTWPCWSKTQGGLLATFRTAAFAMLLDTSQDRINSNGPPKSLFGNEHSAGTVVEFNQINFDAMFDSEQ